MTLTTTSAQAAVAPRAPAPSRRPSWLARWLSRLGLLLFGLLLPLLMVELALRLFGPILPGNYRTGSFQAAHPVYGRFQVPNFDGWIRSPEFVSHMKTNSLGLRDDEIVMPKPPDTFRILVVGDSFVQASQVLVGEPFSDVLERSLNALPAHAGRPQRYDVVNAGVGGWGPGEELLWLRNEGMKLQPDLVIVQLYLGNDISDSGCKILGQDKLKHKVCFYFDRNGQLYQDELRPRPPLAYDWLRSPLRQVSLLFNVVETGVFEKADQTTYDQGPASNWKSNMGVYARTYARKDRDDWEEAWGVAGALLGQMKTTAESGGAGFLLTAAPSVFQVYRDEWDQAVDENNLKPDEWDLDRPNARLGEIAASLNARYLDLTPAFIQAAPTSPRRLFYHSDRHYTAAGHLVVGQTLQDYLLTNRLVP
jgi:hypothetical protein